MRGRGGAHRRPSRTVAAVVMTVAATVAVAWLALAGPVASARTGPDLDHGGYDGRTLMLGLFFGLGPVAEQYPNLALTRVDDTPENRTQLGDAIAELERRSPGQLAGFRSAMYSGDRDVIATAATEAINRLYLVAVTPNGTGGGTADDPIQALEAIAGSATVPDESALTNGRPNIHPTISWWARQVAATLRL
jgi:hypothetical protein